MQEGHCNSLYLSLEILSLLIDKRFVDSVETSPFLGQDTWCFWSCQMFLSER